MPVPDTFDLTLPVLRLLADGSERSKRHLVQALAAEFALAPADLERRRADGRYLFQNRIEWARTWLKKAGLIEYPKQGWSRITNAGVQLLASIPQRLDKRYFLAGRDEQPQVRSVGEGETVSDDCLEDELRRLSGAAVLDDADWEAVRMLNGWGPEDPVTYEQAATALGRDKKTLLALGKRCRVPPPEEAPLLEATLCLTLAHTHQDPDDLALELMITGLTREEFSFLGLCEAARRFGRAEEWRRLLGYLGKYRDTRRRRPRPFDSWFELDVYLQLRELGYEVTPQRGVGRYRVDMYLQDFAPPVIIECDGDRYHRADRTAYDESRERRLQAKGYTVIRFKYTTFRDKPENIRRGLADILGRLGGGRQLRLA